MHPVWNVIIPEFNDSRYNFFMGNISLIDGDSLLLIRYISHVPEIPKLTAPAIIDLTNLSFLECLTAKC